MERKLPDGLGYSPRIECRERRLLTTRRLPLQIAVGPHHDHFCVGGETTSVGSESASTTTPYYLDITGPSTIASLPFLARRTEGARLSLLVKAFPTISNESDARVQAQRCLVAEVSNRTVKRYES